MSAGTTWSSLFSLMTEHWDVPVPFFLILLEKRNQRPSRPSCLFASALIIQAPLFCVKFTMSDGVSVLKPYNGRVVIHYRRGLQAFPLSIQGFYFGGTTSRPLGAGTVIGHLLVSWFPLLAYIQQHTHLQRPLCTYSIQDLAYNLGFSKGDMGINS